MPPQVDSQGKLTQDFNGRVKKISVKNPPTLTLTLALALTLPP